MKRLLPFIAFCFLVTAVQAQERWHELRLGSFNTLKVLNDMDVVCRCVPDSAGVVRFRCADSDADAVMLESGGGKLKVMISPDFIDRPERVPMVYAYTDSLNFVESSSAGTVRVEKLPRVKSLKAVLMDNGHLELPAVNADKLEAVLATGSGTILLSGRTSNAIYRLIGTGKIDAGGLEAGKVKCKVLGGGDIYCRPLQSLLLTGLGTTRIHYHGSPAKIKKSGLGKLIPMESGVSDAAD